MVYYFSQILFKKILYNFINIFFNYLPEDFIMNNKALEKLEFNKICELLMNYSITYIGKKHINCLHPMHDKKEIEKALKQVTHASILLYRKGIIPIGEIENTTEHIKKIKSNMFLSARQLLDLANILKISNNLKEYYFSTEIDMSEFGEKHNVARLVGAPAGYVGYEDGGKLTEQIRRKPYSVVLFDEIEKAHPDVFNILLQILEDGTLTDGQGTKVKFNNSIVILTSNLGAEEMYRESEMGFSVKTKKDAKALEVEHAANEASAMKALRKLMRPELVNRFDSIITFNALSEKDVDRIFTNMIEDLKKRLAGKSIGLQLTDNAKKRLIEKGYDTKNGARPLRREIEDELETLIADAILTGKLNKGDIAKVDFKNDEFSLSIAKE